MGDAPLIDQLIEALRVLPGVGPKSAQRMAYHLLQRDRGGGERLAARLAAAMSQIGHCQQCHTLTEEPLCRLCRSDRRDRSLLCVVGAPANVAALEQATDYRGLYFVLNGQLSPLDGIGAAEIGLDRLAERLAVGGIEELILATPPTVEGEATAHYIAQIAHDYAVPVTRLAQGVPLGGDLDYLDSGTLSHAFSGRRQFL